MRLSFRIAKRFLRSSIGQTLLIVVGIGVGVAVQIFIGSLINGLQVQLINTTVGNSAQIVVTSNNEAATIENYISIVDTLQEEQPQITKSAAILQSPAFTTSDNESYSLLLRGMSEGDANGIYTLSSKLVEGKLPTKSGEVSIGVDLANELFLLVGDQFSVQTPNQNSVDYKVVGIFDLKVKALNTSWVFSTLADVQSQLDLDNVVNTIEFQVDQVFEADAVAQAIEEKLDRSYEVSNWKAENAQLLSGLNGQSASSYMIQFFVMISVVLAIASVLAISVVQKSRQLGILKAMGINNRMAAQIFLFQGLLLGLFGTIFGVGLGLALTYAFSIFVVNPDGTPVVAVLLNPNFIVISALLALTSATFAALIPAMKVARLNPIDVIRNG
ncbi:MAG: ABC transporter permease [Erysipelotrichaceae bacterium]